MRGYQITFFTQQDRRHEGKPLGEWLMQLAKRLELQGATMVSAAEGFGASGRVHSARFFELGDQPIEVLMTVTEAQADRLFEHLRSAGVHLFYVKTVVEYGTLGAE
ncbi:MAG: DUF190 domain-containing protein [Gammaproteobacteria bacterium]|nr:DUF190 domain-containing protein [Gammaproteobacteria bacterium]